MSKLKSFVENAAAVIYFIFPISFVILLLIFMPVLFLTEVSAMRASGFAGPNSAEALVGVCGLIIGLSLLIPPLRKIYHALPWLFPFIKIFFINLIILNIGITILNYGYQVNSEARHTLFFLWMLMQIALCRVAMCIYFRRRPVKSMKER